MIDKRERRKCTYIFTSLKSEEDDVAPASRTKNGLIVLVEIGVFVLRRNKMGQWASTSNYNKAPQVPKDEKKIEIMLGNGLSMMLESELLSIIITNFLDN